MKNSENSHASLQRRLAAMVYDGLLLFAVSMVAGFLIVPFTRRIELQTPEQTQSIFDPIMLAYYLCVYFVFFAWFWTHGGQTLGMRSWHIRLLMRSGQPLDWRVSFIRFAISLPMWFFWIMAIGKSTGGFVPPLIGDIPNPVIFAVAIIWLLVDHLPNNWRDRITHTMVIYQPRRS